jgi:glycosyltransferase involved in cell wall biosynthesis
MNPLLRPPLVSIIMSMRNSAATVGAAVRSIQLQTLQQWELIVIDDGSSDRSSEIVSAFGDSRIRLVREASSAGLAPRLNQAVALSRGDFIARMDADDICFPDRLQRQVERLQSEPALDVLGSGAAVFTDDGNLVGLLPITPDHDAIVKRPFVGFPLPHPTWCGRAAWFRDNPYDSRLMKAEDQDLLLRSFRHSRFGALESVLLGYRQNQLDLKKLLPGRRAFIGSLWRYGQRSGERLPALQGIATHLAKGAADIVTIGLGLNRLMQRQRLQPVPPATVQQWRALQIDLRGDAHEASQTGRQTRPASSEAAG